MCKKLYEWSVFIINFLIDGVSIFFFRGKATSNDRQSILVVRLDAIGDFILWLNAAAELRKLYSVENYRLVLIGNCTWTELAQIQQIFDEVIPLDRELFYYNFKYRMNIWRLLRATVWSVVIEPTYSREFMFGDSVVRVCGAVEKIGSIGDLSNQTAWQKRISNKWYTCLVPTNSLHMMELERNAEFVRSLGIQSFQAGLPEVVSYEQLPVELSDIEYFILVPGTSLRLHQWPVDNFAKLAEMIQKTYGLKAVICGTPRERKLGDRLSQLLQGDVIDCTGKTTLLEYVSIIKSAQFLIGNDSSAVHIAAAVGVKSFSLLGGMHYGRFLPYSLEHDSLSGKPLPVSISHYKDCFMCNNTCVYVSHNQSYSAPCLEQISVEKVFNEVSSFMSKTGC